MKRTCYQLTPKSYEHMRVFILTKADFQFNFQFNYEYK